MVNKPEPLDQTISLMMSKTELERLDDLRFARRAASRGAVIRDLIRKGMESETSPQK